MVLHGGWDGSRRQSMSGIVGYWWRGLLPSTTICDETKLAHRWIPSMAPGCRDKKARAGLATAGCTTYAEPLSVDGIQCVD